MASHMGLKLWLGTKLKLGSSSGAVWEMYSMYSKRQQNKRVRRVAATRNKTEWLQSKTARPVQSIGVSARL